MNSQELAGFLGMSKRSVERWRMTPGKGPTFTYAGKSADYAPGDVLAWLATQTGNPRLRGMALQVAAPAGESS
jgi:hypothetical protein